LPSDLSKEGASSPGATASASGSCPAAASIGAIVVAVEALVARTCTIDGEATACREDGLADFELLRYRQRDAVVVAFKRDRRPRSPARADRATQGRAANDDGYSLV
jgi:hypothetical protein